MIVKEIVTQYIKDARYGGLYNSEYPDEPCMCNIKNLMNCENPSIDCRAGEDMEIDEKALSKALGA